MKVQHTIGEIGRHNMTGKQSNDGEEVLSAGVEHLGKATQPIREELKHAKTVLQRDSECPTALYVQSGPRGQSPCREVDVRCLYALTTGASSAEHCHLAYSGNKGPFLLEHERVDHSATQ